MKLCVILGVIIGSKRWNNVVLKFTGSVYFKKFLKRFLSEKYEFLAFSHFLQNRQKVKEFFSKKR
jgi:hypothetical protein